MEDALTFPQIIDGLFAPIATTTADGRVDFANRQLLDYLGMSLEELKNWETSGAVHPDDLPRVVTAWRQSVERGEPYEAEQRIRRADGIYQWVRVRGLPLRDTHNRILRWCVLLADIADRKRAEALLDGEKRLLEMVAAGWPLEKVLEAICGIVDTVVSNSACSILLIDPNGKFRHGAGPTLPPGYDDAVNGARVACEAGPCGTAASLKEQVVVLDLVSDPRWVGLGWRTLALEHGLKSVCSTPILSLTGKVLGTFAIYKREPGPPTALLRDLIARFTHVASIAIERTISEHELQERERESRMIVDTIPGLVSTFSASGEIEILNQRMLEYFGKPLDEMRHWEENDIIHPEDLPRVIRLLTHALASQEPLEYEARLRRFDAVYRWFQVRAFPARDSTGRVVRWYTLITDIDDLKRAEAELRALKDRLYEENLVLRDEVDRTSMFEEIVGTSRALQPALARVSKVARTESTVLITGETGTGKELVARAIHRRSPRSSRPFVSVNCAAVPRELIASELFGHEKGAFTGATQRRLGRFELAHGGTIFLDEIGDLPMETQIALLRILQEREFERVGGSTSIRVDVRVIAATNRDLPASIEAGTFRSDLFYRLNVFPIAVPALRERADDIPVLVEYFIDRYSRKAGKTIRRVNTRTLDHLRSYLWPGNVRELQNVIERSVIVCDTEEFTVDESWLSARPTIEGRLALRGTLVDHEKAIIEDALRASGGRVFGSSGAAARLGIPRSTLESKIRALKINKKSFRPRSAKS
jgi:PAS domain S-box-containing protein